MQFVLWINVGLMLTIAAFMNKRGFLNILFAIGCVMVSLGNLYWIFEL